MSNRRVLVVEDDELIRLILSESLADEGYDVAGAGSGDEAIDLIDGPNAFDVVITDIQMPGRSNGIVVGRHVHEVRPATPVIYVTGRPESLTGVDLGPRDAFVRKPYGPFDMIKLVAHLLDRPLSA